MITYERHQQRPIITGRSLEPEPQGRIDEIIERGLEAARDCFVDVREIAMPPADASAGDRSRQGRKKPPYVSTEVAGLSMKFGSKPAVPESKEASLDRALALPPAP